MASKRCNPSQRFIIPRWSRKTFGGRYAIGTLSGSSTRRGREVAAVTIGSVRVPGLDQMLAPQLALAPAPAEAEAEAEAVGAARQLQHLQTMVLASHYPIPLILLGSTWPYGHPSVSTRPRRSFFPRQYRIYPTGAPRKRRVPSLYS